MKREAKVARSEKCWELLPFVIWFRVLVFPLTFGQAAASSGEVAKETKLFSMDSQGSGSPNPALSYHPSQGDQRSCRPIWRRAGIPSHPTYRLVKCLKSELNH